MARLAIRATSDSSKRQKVITAQARVLLTVERDGKDYAELGIYRIEEGPGEYDGRICLTIEGTHKDIRVDKTPNGFGHVIYI